MVLKFATVALGDFLLSATPTDTPAQALRKSPGLFRDAVSIIALGRNMAYGLECKVHFTRAQPTDVAAEVMQLKTLQQTQGVVQVLQDDGLTIAFDSDANWWCESVESPALADGFAGRVADVTLMFSGATALTVH